MFVKQISVFLENRSGELRKLTEIVGNAGIDLMALSVADTESFGIVRFIVPSDQLDRAYQLLLSEGYTARINRVVCVCVPDRPAGLCEVLTMLENAGIAVEYLYSFLHPTAEKALLILRLEDNDRGYAVLESHGVELLSSTDVENL